MSNIIAPGRAPQFGAPGIWVRYGKDGARYCVGTAQPPGSSDIRPAAWRILPDGRMEWLNIGSPPVGVAGFVEETDTGANVLWFISSRNEWVVTPLPGYVRRGLPDNAGQAPVAPTPPPAAASGPAVDEVARKYTSDVKKELKGDIARIEQRLAALQTGAGGGLNAAQVQDHIWSKAPDAIYARLQANDAGLVGEIRRIAGAQQGGATMDRAALKALVREVLLELLKD